MKTKNVFQIALFLLIGIVGKLYSQNTFKTIFPSSAFGSTGACIITFDSIYIFGDYGGKTLLRGFDSSGVINYSHSIKSVLGSPPGQYGSKSFFIHDFENLIMPLVGTDSLYRICLTSFNMKTNLFNWITGFNINVGNNYINPPITLNKIFNKFYAISSYKWHSVSNLQRWPIVVTADSVGNLIQSYRIENHYGIAMFTHQVSNDSYITGINYRDTLGATLVRYDTSGSVLWAKTYFTKGSIFHSAVNNNDGTLTLIGAIDTSISPAQTQLFFMKIDTTGAELWCKALGDSNRAFRQSRGSQVKPTSDGGYIIIGYACGSVSNINYKSDLILIKTDTNGDTLWTRCHGNEYTEEGGDDVEQTSDGGYIMTGFSNTAQFLPSAYAGYIVFKTDSLGMTDTHCQEFSMPMTITDITAPDINITVTITTGLISAVPSTVVQEVDSIGQKNGCWLSAVGIDEPKGKSNMEYQAIPNPSAGLFTLKSNTANMGSKTIIVYDIYGHEIFTLQHSAGTELQFDLRSYHKGVYFVRIIQGNKVEMVKAVVE
jgi:hypothetical protein